MTEFRLLIDVYIDQISVINVINSDETEVYYLNTHKIRFTYEPE